MKPLTYKLFFDETDDSDVGAREYWDSGLGAAGCIFIAKDTGRILLARRSGRVDFEPYTWGTWGGKVNEGEEPSDTVAREVEEETGYDGEYKVTYLWTFNDEDANFQYHNYLVLVPMEFTPQLNWENSNSAWVEYGDWPEPMHFGLEELIKHAGDKIRRIVELIKQRKGDMMETMDAPPAIVQHTPTNASANYNITNAYIVAATLWGEARGEGERGMHAVLNVIMNRAKGNFQKARDVVLASKQFSMWNDVSEPAVTAMAMVRNSDDQWLEAVRLVDRASQGNLPDITHGATFYFNPKKANPSWAKKMVRTARIGNHDFYKPQKKKKKAKEAMCLKESYVVSKKGLVDDGVWAYEMRSPQAFIRYRYEPATKTFYLDNISTPNVDDRNKGYAKALLESFFQLIKQYGGALDAGSYTTSGMAYIKHVVERFSQQYGVRLVKGTAGYD